MLTISRRGPEPLNLSLPDFDKGHRCPGWSGEGMRYNKVNWCNDELAPGQSRWALTVRRAATPRAGVEHATELPGFYSWRLRRTNCCNTIVLPQFTYLLSVGAWFYWSPGFQVGGSWAPGRLRLGSGWQTLRWQWWKLRRLLTGTA